MKALHFGAGKIGRGFIGAVLAEAGYKVVFIDAQQWLVEMINRQGSYDVHLIGNQPVAQHIEGISALAASDESVAENFVDADLVTTAVSMSRLADVAPIVARGIERRCRAGVTAPINIICCENGIRATSHLRTLVCALLDSATLSYADKFVGFVDCGVDRIVPIVTLEQPLDVAVEPYFEWCIDRTAIKGTLSELHAAHFVDNIDAYISRKLFTLNTAHCTTAYLGAMKGYKYIHEAVCDNQIREVVIGVMRESGAALVRKFDLQPEDQQRYSEQILQRFANQYLGDTVSRVSRDPMRKLSPGLYFSHPISMALQFGVEVDHLATAVAAVLKCRNSDDLQSLAIGKMITQMGVKNTVQEVCKIENSAVLERIEARYYEF